MPRRATAIQRSGSGEVQEAEAGDIVALSGFEKIEIGKTFTSVDVPERMEGIAVEEHTISVDFIVNNGPFAGQDGKYVTSRQLKDRLYRELERNVVLTIGSDTSFEQRLEQITEALIAFQQEHILLLKVLMRSLLDHEARQAGFDPATIDVRDWDHKRYYPDARELVVCLSGDRRTGRLLGAQMLGHRSSEVAKRIDVAAAALFHGMSVDALNDLDLSYTPPFGSPWDPIQDAAQAWTATQSARSLKTEATA